MILLRKKSEITQVLYPPRPPKLFSPGGLFIYIPMDRAAFEKLVEEGIARIPKKFRDLIDNVAFFVEDEPSAAVREKEGLGHGETLLGYYHGIPTSERGEGYGGLSMPDTIFIYQKPIEQEANDDPDRIRDVVAETVWHEIGHHFGLGEHEVRARERKRFL